MCSISADVREPEESNELLKKAKYFQNRFGAILIVFNCDGKNFHRTHTHTLCECGCMLHAQARLWVWAPSMGWQHTDNVSAHKWIKWKMPTSPLHLLIIGQIYDFVSGVALGTFCIWKWFSREYFSRFSLLLHSFSFSRSLHAFFSSNNSI